MKEQVGDVTDNSADDVIEWPKAWGFRVFGDNGYSAFCGWILLLAAPLVAVFTRDPETKTAVIVGSLTAGGIALFLSSGLLGRSVRRGVALREDPRVGLGVVMRGQVLLPWNVVIVLASCWLATVAVSVLWAARAAEVGIGGPNFTEPARDKQGTGGTQASVFRKAFVRINIFALIFAWSVKAALLEPFAITCMMEVYFRTIAGQVPDPAWEAKLDSLSAKFTKLKEKARTYQPPRATPEAAATTSTG